MIEEPYRWVEAIANRREYIETQLAPGSPIAALSYRDGILFVTVGQARQKLFEIYDRIAMGAIGHPGDIERLRMAAIELASTEGFTRSAADVSLAAAGFLFAQPALENGFRTGLRRALSRADDFCGSRARLRLTTCFCAWNTTARSRRKGRNSRASARSAERARDRVDGGIASARPRSRGDAAPGDESRARCLERREHAGGRRRRARDCLPIRLCWSIGRNG